MNDVEAVAALKSILTGLIPESCRYALIHSSLMSFIGIPRPVENSIHAIKEVADERGITIALPTYSPEVCGTGLFSVEGTPCNTGVLPEAFRKSPGVIRSAHPIDSYACYGAEAGLLAQQVGTELHGPGSMLDFFDRHASAMVVWGAGIHDITYIHYCEFARRPEYRMHKEFHVRVEEGKGARPFTFGFQVRKPGITIDFHKIAESLKDRKGWRKATLLRALFHGILTADLKKDVVECLEKNPLILVKPG